ncbi:biotin transporter BioY [Hyphomonas sp. WL0036]|uniref:biotin transporter BioY n=1 Tax=Hyphomonas sediminis TaxID=2866160 RepID=UPI001C8060A4|nr:biotin transporter BioY [Hyphomonas sediminis]MBY9068418.1 biotin transporter BioY [Hyphomonas sediminis]
MTPFPPPARAALAACLGVAALTAASYASVPMYPVPMTLQTLAVLLAGALAGPRLGAAIVVAWLALALGGAPVLSGGKGGLAALTGGTAGFLLSFPLAAYLAGLLPAWRGAGGFARLVAAFLLLHGLILLAGWGRLSLMIGAEAAFSAGVGPFLPGAAVKSALAALIVVMLPARAGIAAPRREA